MVRYWPWLLPRSCTSQISTQRLTVRDPSSILGRFILLEYHLVQRGFSIVFIKSDQAMLADKMHASRVSRSESNAAE